MHRDLLSHLPVLLAVARCGGFSAAAAQLKMSPSAVSHAIKTVEDSLGVALFVRTTRSVALTQAGAQIIASIEPALNSIEDAADHVRACKGRLAGVLRLKIAREALPMALTPILTQMALRHPALTIEMICDDDHRDFVAGGFDAGVRFEEVVAEDLIAVRLLPRFKTILVAAPSYLKSKGAPRTIAGLGKHNCIGQSDGSTDGVHAWNLRVGGEDVRVRVSGTTRVTDAFHAKELALAGLGIAYVFEPIVRREIRNRELRALLPATCIEEAGLFLYFPRGTADTPKLRAFVDVAEEVMNMTSKRGAGKAALA